MGACGVSNEEPLVIETSLTKDQFIRLSILRHIQRPTFYFIIITASVLTVWALYGGPFLLIFVVWTPLILYLIFGVVSAYRDSKLRQTPFLPTRYEFGKKGVQVSTSEGSSLLPWNDFVGWRTLVGCYVLVLSAGAILAIPQQSLPKPKQEQLETMLTRRIAPRA
jgi:hypothetical protein